MGLGNTLLAADIASDPGLIRVPGWEQYSWLRAGFSTRLGGCSSAYGESEQNLGWTAGDDPASVAANRAGFVKAVGQGTTLELVTVQQVHGARVRNLDAEVPPYMSPEGKAQLEGDGIISASQRRLLAILTADCVPVLMADVRTHAIGAFHAGWRGTLAGIVPGGIRAMQQCFHSQSQDLVAAVGPCIRDCCFEVGPEVREAFLHEFDEAESLFSTDAHGSLRLDLHEANRRQLLKAGVAESNIQMLAHCTSCARTQAGRRRFFSYRAERGNTGRMLSGIAAVG